MKQKRKIGVAGVLGKCFHVAGVTNFPLPCNADADVLGVSYWLLAETRARDRSQQDCAAHRI